MQRVLMSILIGFLLFMQASAEEGSLEAFIEDELSAAGIPGVAYAIIDETGIRAGAHGTVDLRTGEAVAPDTPFQLASISKSFTAMAILQLVEAGDVELDGELSQYLDAFSGIPAGAITLRQLLGHTSGYSTLQGNESFVDRPESEDALSHQVDRIAQWSPAHAPGSQWDYSNANYALLGAVIEAVSGLPYDQYVETKILEPIGMQNSFVADGGIYGGVAIGHKPWFGGKRPTKHRKTHTARAGAPGGGVIASAEDLALYVNMMLNGTDDIISAENKMLMMQSASAQAPYYGLGWMLDPQNGIVYHTGTNPGTETLAMMKPEQGQGVIILVNAGSGMGFGETANLINGIRAHAFDETFVPDQSSWGRKLLFLTFALLPLLFGAGAIQAWLGRTGLRAKSGVFGAFSLWFPLLMTSVVAWVSIILIPNLFGVSLSALGVFSPDLAISLLATGMAGLLWAAFRLLVYYVPKLRNDSSY